MLYGEKMKQILEKFGIDTSTGTLILSNEVIETWSSTNTNTKVIYFNKNCDI